MAFNDHNLQIDLFIQKEFVCINPTLRLIQLPVNCRRIFMKNQFMYGGIECVTAECDFKIGMNLRFWQIRTREKNTHAFNSQNRN